MRILLALFLILSFYSCKPEEITEVEVIPIQEPGDIRDIAFSNDGVGYLVGGEVWFYGFVGTTQDNGETWQTDSLSNKLMFDIELNDQSGALGGIDGQFFDLQNGSWQSHRTTEWGFIKDLIHLEDGSTISAGGHAYRLGFINKIDSNYIATRIYTEDIEFSSLLRIGENRILAGAFGKILLSDDLGETWQLTNGTGDFFKDLAKLDELLVFALGYNGLILKSENGGLTWETSRNLGGADKSKGLNAIHVLDNGEIWAVGKSGSIFISNDQGDSWQEKVLNTDNDLLAIASTEDAIFIGGEESYLVKIPK